MSPEQTRGQAVDKRTDIWAFGCVLYEMLTGRPAFAGRTVSDIIAAILDREPDFDALPKALQLSCRDRIRVVEFEVRNRRHQLDRLGAATATTRGHLALCPRDSRIAGSQPAGHA